MIFLLTFGGPEPIVCKLLPEKTLTVGRFAEGADVQSLGAVRLKSKLYLKDTKSSGGTHVNGKRLSELGQESALVQVNKGDEILLGEEAELDGVSVTIEPMFDIDTSSPVAVPMSATVSSQATESAKESTIKTETSPQQDSTVKLESQLDELQLNDLKIEFDTIWNGLHTGMERHVENYLKLSDKFAKKAKQMGIFGDFVVPTTPLVSSHFKKVKSAALVSGKANLHPVAESNNENVNLAQ